MPHLLTYNQPMRHLPTRFAALLISIFLTLPVIGADTHQPGKDGKRTVSVEGQSTKAYSALLESLNIEKPMDSGKALKEWTKSHLIDLVKLGEKQRTDVVKKLLGIEATTDVEIFAAAPTKDKDAGYLRAIYQKDGNWITAHFSNHGVGQFSATESDGQPLFKGVTARGALVFIVPGKHSNGMGYHQKMKADFQKMAAGGDYEDFPKYPVTIVSFDAVDGLLKSDGTQSPGLSRSAGSTFEYKEKSSGLDIKIQMPDAIKPNPPVMTGITPEGKKFQIELTYQD